MADRGFPKHCDVQPFSNTFAPQALSFSQLVLKIMPPPTRVVDHARTAKCPALLCPSQALLMTGWRLAPPRRALPLLPRSYELMRPTSSLLWNSCIHPYLPRSLQVAANPCWKPVLPDVISASLSQDA